MLDKLHNWLIKLIIGKKMVIMNAKFTGGITVDLKNQKLGGLVCDCEFTGNPVSMCGNLIFDVDKIKEGLRPLPTSKE